MPLLPWLLVVLFSSCAQGGGTDTSLNSLPAIASVQSPATAAEPVANKPPPPNKAAMEIPEYRAVYKASYNGLPITLTRTLSSKHGAYQFKAVAENFLGSITEVETFTLNREAGLLPQGYRYERSLFGNKRKETTSFDRTIGMVTNIYKKDKTTLPITPDLLGPLSYQIQMALDVEDKADQLSYAVVTRGKVRNYIYGIDGEESLNTPIGKIDTVRLKRIRETDERETLLWLDKNNYFLPVKLEQEEDGETYEMHIESYTSVVK